MTFLSGASHASPESSDLLPSLAMLKLLFTSPNVSNEPVLVNGLEATGRLSLRMRLKLRIDWRSEMVNPDCGAAMTTVPGLARGGGVGESDRNSGWMCDSLADAC